MVQVEMSAHGHNATLINFPWMQCSIHFLPGLKPLSFPNADYFLCISNFPAKSIRMGEERCCKEEEKQRGGTLSPQVVSCLPCTGQRGCIQCSPKHHTSVQTESSLKTSSSQNMICDWNVWKDRWYQTNNCPKSDINVEAAASTLEQ